MNLTNQQIKQSLIIKKGREQSTKYDNQLYQQKRTKFLDWLSIQYYSPIKFEVVPSKYWYRQMNIFITKAPVMVWEMYSFDNKQGSISSKPRIPIYFKDFSWANTRLKLQSETRAEIDKLPFEKAMAIMREIISALIRKELHFCVFYAEGQRSCHIIIYDFEELIELTEFQRIKAQVKFWRSIVPFGCFQYIDASNFNDDHPVPLEFASHWKYGTIFNLLFEYLPQEEKCKD